MTYFIAIYDEGQCGHDPSLRDLALTTESLILADGHKLSYADGDGFLTYMEFDSLGDMVVFKLKYMTYELKLGYWFLSVYKFPDMTELRISQDWFADHFEAFRSTIHFKQVPQLDSIVVPRHHVDLMLKPEINELINRHNGRVHLYKTIYDALGDEELHDFEWKVAMTESDMTMFKLSI
jgi:hypothetical protein